MKTGNLNTGKVKILDAKHELQLAWNAASEQWKDDTGRGMEDEAVQPLFHTLKETIDAAVNLQEIIQRAQRECTRDN